MKQFICKLADLVGMDYFEIKQTVLCGCILNLKCSSTLFYIAESLSEESNLKIFPKMDEW